MNQGKTDFTKNVLAGIGAVAILTMVVLAVGGFTGDGQQALTLSGAKTTPPKVGTTGTVAQSPEGDPTATSCGYLSKMTGFDSPLGVAVAKWNGNFTVFVTDTNKIYKYNENSSNLNGAGNVYNGLSNSPLGVVVDTNDNIYIADQDRIVKLKKDGGNGMIFDKQWTVKSIFSIAIDSKNIIYVATAGGFIQKFDSNGAKVGNTLGGAHLGQPEGMSVDSSGNIYLTDALSNRVNKINSNGGKIISWGSTGSNDGQFKHPVGIAVDSTRNLVYVVDLGNDRVQVFSTNGAFLYQLKGDSLNGGLKIPWGIALDKDGNLYITNHGSLSPGNQAGVQKYGTSCGRIVITKKTEPKSGQDFQFTIFGSNPSSYNTLFYLDDDSNPTLSNTTIYGLSGNTKAYELSEKSSSYFVKITCSDPTRNTVNRKGDPRTVDVKVDGTETVSCTFLNSVNPYPDTPITDKVITP